MFGASLLGDVPQSFVVAGFPPLPWLSDLALERAKCPNHIHEGSSAKLMKRLEQKAVIAKNKRLGPQAA